MKREEVYASGNYSGQTVNWYWERGLHDARIISTESLDLDYNYKLKVPKRNSFTICLDAFQALYDKSVKRIVFYNFKFLTPEIKLDGCYWLQDKLTKENNKYVLEITATHCRDELIFRISFDFAEVFRNKNL